MSQIEIANSQFRQDTNGKDLFRQVLKQAFQSNHDPLEEAIARFTLFSHPRTVSQFKGEDGRISNVFPIIRTDSSKNKKKIIEIKNKKAMLDDNECAVDLFCWANKLPRSGKGLDRQFNHIWGRPFNRRASDYEWSKAFDYQLYTNLANLCLTPTFIAKLTDTHTRVKDLLRYRSQELYGDFGQPVNNLEKPTGYDSLPWCDCLPPTKNAPQRILNSLKSRKSSETYLATTQIGWLKSDFKPITL